MQVLKAGHQVRRKRGVRDSDEVACGAADPEGQDAKVVGEAMPRKHAQLCLTNTPGCTHVWLNCVISCAALVQVDQSIRR